MTRMHAQEHTPPHAKAVPEPPLPYREEQIPQVLLLSDFAATLDEERSYRDLRAALRRSDIDQAAFPGWYHAMDDALPVTRRAVAVLLLSAARQ